MSAPGERAEMRARELLRMAAEEWMEGRPDLSSAGVLTSFGIWTNVATEQFRQACEQARKRDAT